MKTSIDVKKLKKWAKDKPEFIIIALLVYADFSNYLYPMFKYKSEILKKSKIIAISDIDLWLSYYKDGQLILNTFYKMVHEEAKEITQYAARLLLEFFQEKGISVDELIIGMREHSTQLSEIIQEYVLNHNKVDIKDKGSESDHNNEDLSYINKYPELVFGFLVCVPCSILYGESHTDLYNKALKGDIRSFCKLLRIDKMIISDHNLSHYLRELNNNPNSTKSVKIINALSGSFRPMSIRNYKMRAGSFISRTAENLGYKITARDIADIFDDASKVFHKNNIDTDLEITPQTITKHLQRYRTFWKFMD